MYRARVIRLISWNVNRRPLWQAVSLEGSVDIALLQEAPRPTTSDVPGVVVPDPHGEWTTQGWPSELRTCVVQLSDRVDLVAHPMRKAHEEGDALGVSRRGSLAVADVKRGDEFLFRVASVYAAWESPTAAHRYIYADASAHRLLSDLAPLITGRPRVDDPLIVAGDLNLLYGYGEYGNAYWKRRYATVFERAAAMGLVFVGPQSPHGRQADPWPKELPSESGNVPTFHHSQQKPETATRQLDFVFATSSIADRVTATALNEPERWGESDHCPVLINVDM